LQQGSVVRQGRARVGRQTVDAIGNGRLAKGSSVGNDVLRLIGRLGGSALFHGVTNARVGESGGRAIGAYRTCSLPGLVDPVSKGRTLSKGVVSTAVKAVSRNVVRSTAAKSITT